MLTSIIPDLEKKLLDIKEDYNLVDPFRELYPVLKRFSWRKRNPFKQSRLDFFLVSDSLFHSVYDVKIDNNYRSDHSPVIISFKINEFMKGKGLWKFNNSLLHDTDYVKLVKKQIKDVKEQYSVHIYNKDLDILLHARLYNVIHTSILGDCNHHLTILLGSH